MLPLLLLGCALLEGSDTADTAAAASATPADLVLIVDDSPSMQGWASAIALGAPELVEALASDPAHDWQVGVVLTSVADHGGLLVGAPVAADDAGAGEALQAQVLCAATCWNEVDLPSDPAYVCGAPVEAISREALDCTCGEDAWRDHCGSGSEEGLEAAFLAACRAAETPVGSCYDTVMEEVDVGTNAGLLRAGAPTVFVAVSDEGDGSRRLDNGVSDATVYVDLWDTLGLDAVFHAFGPPWDGADGTCLNGALPYAVERYQGAALATGGVYGEMTTLPACDPGDLPAFFDAVVASTP